MHGMPLLLQILIVIAVIIGIVSVLATLAWYDRKPPRDRDQRHRSP